MIWKNEPGYKTLCCRFLKCTVHEVLSDSLGEGSFLLWMQKAPEMSFDRQGTGKTLEESCHPNLPVKVSSSKLAGDVIYGSAVRPPGDLLFFFLRGLKTGSGQVCIQS